MTDPDYPAAHSMDSCWFAVDQDGRVGFFQTGEAGAVPVRGLVGDPAERARRRIAQEVPAGGYQVDLRGRLLPNDAGGWLRHAGGAEFPVLMFLDSLDPVRDALAAGRATEVKARFGFAVLWPALTEADYQRLHRRAAADCRGCFWEFDLPEVATEGRQPNLGRHGVYVFTALGGNVSANPYGVQVIPARPVHVDQLPPDLRAGLKEVQFEAVSFADQPVFQPVEHVPCTAYGATYTDMRGEAHPLPRDPDRDMPPDEYLRRLEEVLEAEEDADLGDGPRPPG